MSLDSGYLHTEDHLLSVCVHWQLILHESVYLIYDLRSTFVRDAEYAVVLVRSGQYFFRLIQKSI